MVGNRERLERANAAVFERFCAAEPVLVDVLPAIEVVPGMEPNLVLTSGPPRDFADLTHGVVDY